jgi:hypothetical protein
MHGFIRFACTHFLNFFDEIVPVETGKLFWQETSVVQPVAIPPVIELGWNLDAQFGRRVELLDNSSQVTVISFQRTGSPSTYELARFVVGIVIKVGMVRDTPNANMVHQRLVCLPCFLGKECFICLLLAYADLEVPLSIAQIFFVLRDRSSFCYSFVHTISTTVVAIYRGAPVFRN